MTDILKQKFLNNNSSGGGTTNEGTTFTVACLALYVIPWRLLSPSHLFNTTGE